MTKKKLSTGPGSKPRPALVGVQKQTADNAARSALVEALRSGRKQYMDGGPAGLICRRHTDSKLTTLLSGDPRFLISHHGQRSSGMRITLHAEPAAGASEVHPPERPAERPSAPPSAAGASEVHPPAERPVEKTSAPPSAGAAKLQFEMHFNEDQKAGRASHSLLGFLANEEGSTQSWSSPCDTAVDDEEDTDAAEVIELLPLR